MKIAVGFIAFIGMIFYQSLAVVIGWQWFVSPFGVQDIGYAHAMGISALVGLLTYHGNPDRGSDFAKSAIEAYLRVTAVIVFMWIYSQFM